MAGMESQITIDDPNGFDNRTSTKRHKKTHAISDMRFYLHILFYIEFQA